MAWKLWRALLVLPGTVLVLVPALSLWLTWDTVLAPEPAAVGGLRLWLAAILLGLGLLLAAWTCRLFVRVGKGTPAPWDPPERLVVEGPYRHVRNPMISGALMVLAAETLFFGSWALLAWLIVFFLANALYFPLSEEKALERRYGDAYRLYKTNVPRWIPRPRPWQPPEPGS